MPFDMKSLAREPLIHFILAGLAVFALNAALTGLRARADQTVSISRADLERMATLYTAEAGRPPSESDMAAMVADHVRDEVLSREARRLGLDADDTIIKRRLAQKMSFMVDDLAEQKAPTDADLRAWYHANPDLYSEPQRLAFQHVFISRDERGETAEAAAIKVRDELNAQKSPDWRMAGDPFMLSRDFGDVPAREIARTFGLEFADAVLKRPASDAWQGPFASGLGLHVLRITKSTPPTLAPFETVRDQVLADYIDARTRETNEAEIEKLIAQYKVQIDTLP